MAGDAIERGSAVRNVWAALAFVLIGLFTLAVLVFVVCSVAIGGQPQ
jgi:hypothetical protein